MTRSASVPSGAAKMMPLSWSAAERQLPATLAAHGHEGEGCRGRPELLDRELHEAHRRGVGDGRQHVGDVARAGAAVHQAAGQRDGALAAAGHVLRRARAGDLAQQDDGTVALELDEVTVVDDADDDPCGVLDGQVADPVLLHAHQGFVDERALRDAQERRAHHEVDGVVAGATLRHGPGAQVMVGHDADDGAAIAGHQRRRGLALGHAVGPPRPMRVSRPTTTASWASVAMGSWRNSSEACRRSMRASRPDASLRASVTSMSSPST